MFDRVVTLYNFKKAEHTWFGTVIRGCSLEATESSADSSRGTGSTGNVRIHFHCNKDKVFSTDEGSVPYVSTKEFQELPVIGTRMQGLTFTPERDFMVVDDELTNLVVDDDEYENGFYHYCNDRMDHVYMVTNATWYSLIPHFVVGGR